MEDIQYGRHVDNASTVPSSTVTQREPLSGKTKVCITGIEPTHVICTLKRCFASSCFASW